jgi:hypothetical protein
MLGSAWGMAALVAAYATILLVVLAPVLFVSVGGDDSYWLLLQASNTHGSLLEAVWQPLSHAFDFSGAQARTTPLQTSERQAIAVATMWLAKLFAIPPAVVWGVFKLGLLVLCLGAVFLFLRHVTFRRRSGQLGGLSAATIAFIVVSLPLVIALGAKAQSAYTLNGWLYYPSLSYGPAVVYLLVSTLALKASALLHRNYRAWSAPLVIVLVLVAVALNLSYELLALAIPLAAVLVILQPLPPGATWWLRWRGKATVLIALVGGYVALFLYIRLRLNALACHATNTCYAGSVVEINPKTLLYNFIGALPGSNGGFVAGQARALGVSAPSVDLADVAIAVLGALALLGLLASWRIRVRRRAGSDNAAESLAAAPGEWRGLLIVLGSAILIAVGSAVITGITANAVEQVRTPMLSYRNGVVTWIAVALAAVTGVRLLIALLPGRLLGGAVLTIFLLVIVAGISTSLPRNELSARADRLAPLTQAIDRFQWELVLGDPSQAGDDRRCAAIANYESVSRESEARVSRTFSSAYAGYRFYYHRPYCSTGEGLAGEAG